MKIGYFEKEYRENRLLWEGIQRKSPTLRRNTEKIAYFEKEYREKENNWNGEATQQLNRYLKVVF